MESEITAAILAGGAAKRLGGIIKPVINVGGQTILSRMLSVLNEIFSEIVLVSNFPEDFFEGYNIPVVHDIYTGRGPLGGIHSALKNCRGRAVFVFAGDMPLLNKSLIMAQTELFKKQNASILVPGTGALIEPLHAIYSKNILISLEEYLSKGNSNAIRDFLLHSNPTYFEPGDPSIIKKAFMNINSPDDIVIAEEILLKRFS